MKQRSASVRLIGALSSHSMGVLDLLAQILLSSYTGDTTTSHTIMRNVVQNGGEIPQVSLIVSCLMQDMLNESANKTEIMETVISLFATLPSSVQQHYLQKIFQPLVTKENGTRLVYLSLRLLCASEATKLSGFYQQVLQAVFLVLENEKLMFPEIIEAALNTVRAIDEQYNLDWSVVKTELPKFVDSVKNLMSPVNPLHKRYSDLLSSVVNKRQSIFHLT